jgi:hypothetical protein
MKRPHARTLVSVVDGPQSSSPLARRAGPPQRLILLKLLAATAMMMIEPVSMSRM